jgi:hypothetical protein
LSKLVFVNLKEKFFVVRVRRLPRLYILAVPADGGNSPVRMDLNNTKIFDVSDISFPTMRTQIV